MLSSRKMNINNYSNELPNEINKLIEDYTEITFTITYDNLNEHCMKVNLINIFNNEILEEIYLDDTVNRTIKLSSDGTKLVYLDVNNNMSYYDINTKTKNTIELSISSLTPAQNYFADCGVPKYYYFDRNGLYFIIAGNQKTYIIDIMNKKYLYEFNYLSFIIDEVEMISSDYKKVFLRDYNCLYVYDLLTGDELYYDDMETDDLSLGYTDKNMNYIITGNTMTNEIIIKDINHNIIFNYNEDNINDIRGMIFDKNQLVIHFNNYIKIVNIKDNKIKQIDNLQDNEDDCVMELINDKYVIIKKNFNTIIEHIKV